MSLSAWEQQALDTIKDGLTGSDPELAALLITFTRLTAGEEMPVRSTLRARSRRAIQRSSRREHRSRERAGLAYQRLRSRYAALAWLMVTMVMIGVALALSRGDGQSACSGSWWGAACACAAPMPGPPFPGEQRTPPANGACLRPAGHVPGSWARSPRGRKNCCAIRVGTNADKMTTVTSSVYWSWSIRWCVSPNSAEMEPKVRPVAISRVV